MNRITKKEILTQGYWLVRNRMAGEACVPHINSLGLSEEDEDLMYQSVIIWQVFYEEPNDPDFVFNFKEYYQEALSNLIEFEVDWKNIKMASMSKTGKEQ